MGVKCVRSGAWHQRSHWSLRLTRGQGNDGCCIWEKFHAGTRIFKSFRFRSSKMPSQCKREAATQQNLCVSCWNHCLVKWTWVLPHGPRLVHKSPKWRAPHLRLASEQRRYFPFPDNSSSSLSISWSKGFESLCVWPLPANHFTDLTWSYCPPQQGTQDNRGT